MSTKTMFAVFMVMAIYCAYSDAFFLNIFSSKPKLDPSKPESACNPNPCKKEGNCTLDSSKKPVCHCPEGYYGPLCENKNACARKPCKKGTCIVDKVEPNKKYTCKCEAGFVGDRCHKKDKCANNGPCKNGKCVLDKKLKASCTCQNGWGGSKCHKRNCTIAQFKGDNFESSPKTFVNPTFAKKLEDVDKLAKLCHVRIKVLKSFTIAVQNGKQRSGLADDNEVFYAGCGLEIEILNEKGSLICNNLCMGKLPIPNRDAKCFMDGLSAIRIKHSIMKPIIHDGCHLDSKTFALEKELHQVGCMENRF